jgi:hypothetical protein
LPWSEGACERLNEPLDYIVTIRADQFVRMLPSHGVWRQPPFFLHALIGNIVCSFQQVVDPPSWSHG